LEVLVNLLKYDMDQRWSLPIARAHKWFDGCKVPPPFRKPVLFSDQSVEICLSRVQVAPPLDTWGYDHKPAVYVAKEAAAAQKAAEVKAKEWDEMLAKAKIEAVALGAGGSTELTPGAVRELLGPNANAGPSRAVAQAAIAKPVVPRLKVGREAVMTSPEASITNIDHNVAAEVGQKRRSERIKMKAALKKRKATS
jgi:hypothetical protein